MQYEDRQFAAQILNKKAGGGDRASMVTATDSASSGTAPSDGAESEAALDKALARARALRGSDRVYALISLIPHLPPGEPLS